ncbi:MAG: ABC transporter substrate-binding protein [Rhodobacteraceae bacterium]|nr:ABC transporter substrate-binding protein [Paracoccaceae bacterium]
MQRFRTSRIGGSILAAVSGLSFAGAALAGSLTIGTVADPVSLDPGNHRDRNAQSLLGNIYDGPFVRLPGGTRLPSLFAEWIEVNPTTYEAVIRTDVKFHSGEPMTIEDVKFSFDRITVDGALDGATSPRKGLAGPIASTEILGPDRLRINLTAPSPTLPASLSSEGGIQIVNQSFVEAAGPGGLATQADGTGPFRLVSWTPGDRIVLERHPDYYGGPAEPGPVGPARLDGVTFRTIPDTSARLAALLAGEIDIAAEIPPFLRPQVEASGVADVVAVNGTRSFFVVLNNTRPPFDDIRVRKAANHAIDRDLIIERVLENTASKINGILSAESFGASELPSHDYDPELARRLLAEAGYANGVDVVLDTQGPFKDLAEVIAAQLTEVGIRASVQVWEGSVITPIWADKTKRERDMYLSSWGSAGLDPNGIFVPTLRTNDRGNYSGYSNPEVDRLLEAAQYNTNSEERARQYAEAEALVNADAPLIFLWVPQDIYGVNKRVRDWAPLPSAMIYMHRATVE